MTSKLQSLLKERINENIKAHSSINNNFEELDAYKVGKLETLRLDNIRPNQAQPRLIFDENELKNLADSINDLGLLQPIIVRPVASTDEKSYEIVAGERRYRACKLLNKKYIDTIVIATTEENNVLLALAENLSRADLTDFEIASSILKFKDKFPSRTEYAKALGISRQKLYKLLAFENLPLSVLEKLQTYPSMISADTAEKISSLSKNPEINLNLLNNKISQGIDLIADKKLRQSNLVEFIEKEMECPNSDTLDLDKVSLNNMSINKVSINTDNYVRRMYHNQGKPIGKIRNNGKKLVVEFDSMCVDEEKQHRIERFFDDLFGDK